MRSGDILVFVLFLIRRCIWSMWVPWLCYSSVRVPKRVLIYMYAFSNQSFQFILVVFMRGVIACMHPGHPLCLPTWTLLIASLTVLPCLYYSRSGILLMLAKNRVMLGTSPMYNSLLL